MRLQYGNLLLSALLFLAVSATEGSSGCEKNLEAVETGRKCRKPCSSDGDCKSRNKRCRCDGACGLSCIGLASVCDEPGPPINGWVYRTSVRWKGVATYTCDNGYYMIGKNTRVCHSDRFWSGSVPQCERGCNIPRDLGNSFLMDEGTGFKAGHTATFQCRTGYNLAGTPTRTCLDDLSGWSAIQFTCTRKICRYLENIDNGEISYTAENKWASRATLQCDVGYEPEFSYKTSVICTDSESQEGEWTGRLSECVLKYCSAPEDPVHGSVEVYNDALVYGSVVRYECDHGFKLIGQEEGQCDENNSWGVVPTCIVDASCSFNEYTVPFCAFVNERETWARVSATEPRGYSGFVAQNSYSNAKLTSPSIPEDWSDAGICLKFHYKIQSYENSGIPALSIQKMSILQSTEFDTVWETHEAEKKDIWLDTALNMDLGEGIKFHFLTGGGTMQLDNVDVLQMDCDDHCSPMPCLNGGSCVNRADRHTCFCVTGFKGVNCEIDTRCPTPPPRIPNGYLAKQSSGLFLPGVTVTYRCDVNYKFDGHSVIKTSTRITCLRHSSIGRSRWNENPQDDLACVDITCPSPTIRANQQLLRVQSIWLVDDEAVYTCAKGYRISSGYTTLQCQNNGEWSKNAPYCSRVRCDVSQLENAVSDNRRYYYRDVRTITCRRGFEIQGQERVTCQSNGKWEILPTCERVRCQQLHNIEHGVRVPMRTFSYEDSYEYSCMKGWRISGNARLVCRFDGSWSSSTPTCEQIKCEHPDAMDGRIILPEKYNWFPSDEATVSCKEFYEISEERNVTCGANGQWSAQFPTCSRISCSHDSWHPSDPVAVFPPAPWYVGVNVRFRCPNGYETNDPTSSTCSESRKWEPSVPICTKISCGPVPLVEHMLNVQLGESKYFGDSYQYVGCAGGYYLRGFRDIVCQANGKWSEIPRCREAAACSDFPVPQNVIETFDNNEDQNRIKWFEGDTRKFYCLPMFTLYGVPELTCQEDGSWSHPAPRCTEIAPVLSKVLHGYEYSIYDDSNNNKEEALNMCSQIGGILVEIRSRDIQDALAHLMWKNGFTNEMYIGLVKKNDSWIWSDGHPPEYSRWRSYYPKQYHTCSVIGYWCWAPGHYFCWRSVDCRDRKLSFMCQRAYDPCRPNPCLNGGTCNVPDTENTAVCTCTVEWKGDKCQTEKTCHRPTTTSYPDFIQITHANGRAVADTVEFRIGHNITFGCIEASKKIYQHSGTLTCTNEEKWNQDVPSLCEFICEKPTTPEHGSWSNQVISEHFFAGDKLEFTCDNGFEHTSQEELSIECTADGIWTLGSGICKRVLCDAPALPDRGYIVGGYSGHYLYGTNITIACHDGKVIPGNDTMTCSDDGTWTNQRLECVEYNPCHPNPCQNGGSCNVHDTENVAVCTCMVRWNGDRCQTEISCFHDPWRSSDPVVDSPPSPWYVGVVVRFRCRDGYETNDPTSITCTETQEWEPSVPTCTRISCGTLPLIDHMLNVDYSEIKYAEESYRYEGCAGGYFLRGPREIVCRSNGEWSEIPRCTEVAACPPFPVPENSREIFSVDQDQTRSDWFERDTRKFRCIVMYSMKGSSILTCQEDGNWSHLPPRCIEIKPSLSTVFQGIEYLMYNGSYTYKQNQASNLCSRIGGILAEITSREIQNAMGRLMGPNRYYSQTYIGLTKQHGSWTWSDGHSAGYTKWRPGYPKSSHTCAVIQPWCGKSGHYYCWKSIHCDFRMAFMCQRAYNPCHSNPCLNGGTCNVQNNASVTNIASCTCTAGWKGVNCETEKTCQRPTITEYIQITHVDGMAVADIPMEFKIGQNLNFGCNEASKRIHQHSGSLTCTNEDTWDQEVPSLCEYICGQPTTPEHGSWGNQVISEYYFAGDELEFTCDTGFMHPSQEQLSVECNADGNWTPGYVVCERVTCDDPALPDRGYIVDDPKHYQYGTNITIACLDGKAIFGDDGMTCSDGGVWTNQGLECLAVTCSLHSDWLGAGIHVVGYDLGSNSITINTDEEVELSCQAPQVPVAHEQYDQQAIITCNPGGRWSTNPRDFQCINSCKGRCEAHSTESICCCDHGCKAAGNCCADYDVVCNK